MQKNIFIAPFYLFAVACLGLGDTLYLSYYEHLGLTPTCQLLNGCEQVLNSMYAKVYGVPVAYVGLIFYAYMLAGALLLILDPQSKGLRWGMLVYTTIGLLTSIKLESIQILSIHAICEYCAISAITTLALFCIALWHFRTSKSRFGIEK